MNIQTKKLPKNLLEITVEIPFSEIKPFYQRALEEFGEEIKIPGFRPGKAPLEMVKNEIGEIKILEEGAEKMLNDKYPEIMEKALHSDQGKKSIPAGPPQIQIQKLAMDNPGIFKLTVPLIPTVKLGNYRRIKIEKKEKIEIKDEETEKVIDELRHIQAKESAVDREIRTQDKVQIDLDLFIDKVPLENGQIKDFHCLIGNDQYLPGLSENLKGLRRGEEKEFSFTYPADHYDKKLAGKKVDFRAKIKNIYQVDLPELNDEFAKNVGPFKTVSEFKEKIKENLLREKKNKEEQKTEMEILNKLIEVSEFEELPEILIEHELDKMLDELQDSIVNGQAGSFKFEDYLKAIKKTEEDLRKDLVPQAEKRIKIALAIREISLTEKIEPEKKEIDEELAKLKKIYQNQEQAIKNLESETGIIYVKNLVVNRKVIEWLKNKLNVKA